MSIWFPRVRHAVLYAGFLSILLGCGSGGTEPSDNVAEVRVTLASDRLVVGETSQASATVRDAAGNVLAGRTIAWISSTPSVASVTANGLVTAVSPGSASITASSDGHSGGATVTVTLAPVASVVVSVASSQLLVNETTRATATLRDSRGNELTGRTISWTSSAPSVASVASDGVVTAFALGSATITATSEGQSASAAIAVIPPPVVSVTVALSAAPLAVGSSAQATATLRDAGGNVLTGRAIAWTSSAPQIASVNTTGRVTGLAVGSATITATSEGRSGAAPISVIMPPVHSISVSLTAGEVFIGETAQATAIARDNNSNVLSGRPITWTSSAPTVASVTQDGLVTALAWGNATITASSEGVTSGASIVSGADVGYLFWRSTSLVEVWHRGMNGIDRFLFGGGYSTLGEWSRDGSKLLATRHNFVHGRADTYVVPLNGTPVWLAPPNPSWIGVSEARWSPDGTKVVATASSVDGNFHNAQIVIYDLVDGTSQVVVNAATAFGQNHIVFQPSWSPDGSTIAFSYLSTSGTRRAGVWLYSVATGVITMLMDFQTQVPAGAVIAPQDNSWSPDGRYVLHNYSSNGDKFFLIDVQLKQLTPLHSATFIPSNTFWSPDGRSIAMTSGSETAPGATGVDAYILDLASGQRRRLTTSGDLGAVATWSPTGKTLLFQRNFELWAIDADGTNARMILPQKPGGFIMQGSLRPTSSASVGQSGGKQH